MLNKLLIFLLLPINLFSQINIVQPKDIHKIEVNNFLLKNIKYTPLKVSVKLGVNTDTFNDFIESEQDNDPSNDGIDFENLAKVNFRIFYQRKDISYFIGDKIIYKNDLVYIGIRFSFDLNYDNDEYEKK